MGHEKLFDSSAFAPLLTPERRNQLVVSQLAHLGILLLIGGACVFLLTLAPLNPAVMLTVGLLPVIVLTTFLAIRDLSRTLNGLTPVKIFADGIEIGIRRAFSSGCETRFVPEADIQALRLVYGTERAAPIDIKLITRQSVTYTVGRRGGTEARELVRTLREKWPRAVDEVGIKVSGPKAAD